MLMSSFGGFVGRGWVIEMELLGIKKEDIGLIQWPKT